MKGLIKKMVFVAVCCIGFLALSSAFSSKAVADEKAPLKFLIAEQATRSICVYEECPGKMPILRWRWSAKDDPNENVAKNERGFVNPSECKVREDGKTIIMAASGGCAAGIDVKSGACKWFVNTGGNPHSVEVLPDGRVAVATAESSPLYIIDVKDHPFEPKKQTVKAEFKMRSAHGVWWDAKRKTLFALDLFKLYELDYDSATMSVTLRQSWDFDTICRNRYGHDLISDGKDGYFFSTHNFIWHVDPETAKVEKARNLANVKGFSPAADGDLLTIPKERWWTDTLLVFPSGSSDTNAARKIVIPGAKIYKARHFNSSCPLPEKATSALLGVNERKREQKLDIFSEHVYGKRPVERPKDLTFSDASPECDMLDGAAVRKQVRISYSGDYGKNGFVVTAFLPKKADKPVPAFLLICNRDIKEYADPTRKVKNGFWPVEEIVARGYAALMFDFNEVTPDSHHGCKKGVFECFEDVKADVRANDAWGTISAWAWGASRVLDWIETESRIDAKKVAVVGHSRGGKTALWAGATDERFAYTCVNCSGCSGAKLNHMDLPKSEHINQIVAAVSYWFCKNYRDCVNRDQELCFDYHELLSCVAPRLLAVGSAADDAWAGPDAERLATELATKAWERKERNRVLYHSRSGDHDLTLVDWNAYMDHAKANGW